MGRDPLKQNFRKFRSKTQWIGSVQPEKFRKNWSTFWGGPLFPVGPVWILVEWIAPHILISRSISFSVWEVHVSRCRHLNLVESKTALLLLPPKRAQAAWNTKCNRSVQDWVQVRTYLWTNLSEPKCLGCMLNQGRFPFNLNIWFEFLPILIAHGTAFSNNSKKKEDNLAWCKLMKKISRLFSFQKERAPDVLTHDASAVSPL